MIRLPELAQLGVVFDLDRVLIKYATIGSTRSNIEGIASPVSFQPALGLAEVVEEISSLKPSLTLGVITYSATERVTAALNAIGINRYFPEVVVFHREGLRHSTTPEDFLAIQRRMRNETQPSLEMIAVVNQLESVEHAKEAGLKTAFIANSGGDEELYQAILRKASPFRPDFVIPSMACMGGFVADQINVNDNLQKRAA